MPLSAPHRSRRLSIAVGLTVVLLSACGGGSESRSIGDASQATSSGALAGPGSAASATDAGGSSALADLGFRADKNGFSFPNYGPGPSLTDADVQKVYGDAVCVSTAGGTCLLSEQAKAWQKGMNDSMAGGHCYGFSVAALEIYKGSAKPSDFGGNDIASLKMDSPGITSRISIDWVAQTFDSVRSAAVGGTPNDVLDKLIAYLKSGSSGTETYTITIFSDKGGHAVTPYAAVDRGNGMVGVLVYDNNFPGVPREVMFDRNANTFAYNSAANPSEPPEVYSRKIALFPTTPGLGVQPCPFCGAPAAAPSAMGTGGTVLASARLAADSAGRYTEVFLSGNPADHAHLVFMDDAGHKTGIVNGTMVNDVPGVTVLETTYDEYAESAEPVYRVAAGTKVAVTIDGSSLKATDKETLDLVGPGIDAQVKDLAIAPGQQDTMTLSADGTVLSYHTPNSDSPTLELARQDTSADWAADLAVHGGAGGATLVVALTDQTLGIGGADDTGATYDLSLTREDSGAANVFHHAGITLAAGDVAALDYTKYAKHGDAIAATFHRKGGATDQQSLDDQG